MRTTIALLLLLSFNACRHNSAHFIDSHANGNWHIFRGDPGLKGFADIDLPERLHVLWTFKSDARTASSPVVSNNVVYWCDKRGKIYGVNSLGRQVFSYDFATAIEGSPLILDSTLYIGRIDGCMSALSLLECDTLWNFETQGQISASPNFGIAQGRESVIFGSYDNFLYCVDKINGKEITRYETGYYINGAVAVQRQFFFSGGCDAWLRIIDGDNALVTDSLLLSTYIPASPAIDGDDCYIADHAGNVYHIITSNGKIVSHRIIVEATDNNSAFVSVPALSPSTLFILSDDRRLYAIDRKTGDIRWKFLQKGQSGESSPVVCRNIVISCTKSGIISLLDAATGNLLWEYDCGEPISASPAITPTNIYILTTRGSLLSLTNPH